MSTPSRNRLHFWYPSVCQMCSGTYCTAMHTFNNTRTNKGSEQCTMSKSSPWKKGKQRLIKMTVAANVWKCSTSPLVYNGYLVGTDCLVDSSNHTVTLVPLSRDCHSFGLNSC